MQEIALLILHLSNMGRFSDYSVIKKLSIPLTWASTHDTIEKQNQCDNVLLVIQDPPVTGKPRIQEGYFMI